MVSKTCKTCGVCKTISLFYKQKNGLLGRTGSCKECRLKYQSKYTSEHKEEKNAYGKKWYEKNKIEISDKSRIWRRNNPGYFKHYYYQNKELKLSIDKRWREKNPDRMKAYKIFTKSLKLDLIKKPENCSMCGEKTSKIHGHHSDYSKPLDVIWVCFDCHLHIHKKIRKIKS